MAWWSLRIDELEGLVDLSETNKICLDFFLKGSKENSSQHLVVKEIAPGGKVHYHAVICTRDSESTIRKQCFHESLKAKRMSKYCHKILDEEELNKAIRYICKATEETKPDVKLQSKIKFTDDYIQFMHDEYWRIHKDCLAKGYKETKQGRSLNFIEEVAFELQKQRAKWSMAEYGDRRAVRHALYRAYKNQGKGFDLGVVKKHMYGVLNILDPTGTAEYFEELFENNHL